jgi:hypothetical protein
MFKNKTTPTNNIDIVNNIPVFIDDINNVNLFLKVFKIISELKKTKQNNIYYVKYDNDMNCIIIKFKGGKLWKYYDGDTLRSIIQRSINNEKLNNECECCVCYENKKINLLCHRCNKITCLNCYTQTIKFNKGHIICPTCRHQTTNIEKFKLIKKIGINKYIDDHLSKYLQKN